MLVVPRRAGRAPCSPWPAVSSCGAADPPPRRRPYHRLRRHHHRRRRRCRRRRCRRRRRPCRRCHRLRCRPPRHRRRGSHKFHVIAAQEELRADWQLGNASRCIARSLQEGGTVENRTPRIRDRVGELPAARNCCMADAHLETVLGSGECSRLRHMSILPGRPEDPQ